MKDAMSAKMLLGLGERVSKVERRLCAMEKFLIAFLLVVGVIFLWSLI